MYGANERQKSGMLYWSSPLKSHAHLLGEFRKDLPKISHRSPKPCVSPFWLSAMLGYMGGFDYLNYITLSQLPIIEASGHHHHHHHHRRHSPCNPMYLRINNTVTNNAVCISHRIAQARSTGRNGFGSGGMIQCLDQSACFLFKDEFERAIQQLILFYKNKLFLYHVL